MPEARLIVWDAQQGNAAYLRTPNGRHIVIDLGTGSYESGGEFSPLRYLVQGFGIRQLDYVIITHPHTDHIDDIMLFDALNPKMLHRPKHLARQPILDNANEFDRPKLEKYFQISDRYDEPITADLLPGDPNNWGGLSIRSFLPSLCSQSNINNHSIVTVLELEGVRALIPGDNEPPSWNELKQMPGFLEATGDLDVLLAPHHGRDSGFDNEVMRHFNPQITIVSDGAWCDTSATDRYSAISRGWQVFNRYNELEERKRYCLTTRSDGVITVTFGKEPNAEIPFLGVRKGR